jgi:hypothetical protein
MLTPLLTLDSGESVAAQRTQQSRFSAQLTNPATIQLGTGGTTTYLSTSRDYIIKLPAGEKRGYTAIVGGRNILIDGGTIVMSGSGTDMQRRAIYIKNATGTVRVQNVAIRGSSSTAAFDAFAISAPQAIVELVNINVSNLHGRYAGYHGDIVQPFGGVRKLVINGLTGRTGYQGFYLDYSNIGAVELRNVSLSYYDNPYDASTVMIWFDGCSSYPVTMQNVYIQPRPGQTVGRSVRPNSGSCAPRQSGSNWSWPSSASIDGYITHGTMANGGSSTGQPDQAQRADNVAPTVRVAAPNRARAGSRIKLAARATDNVHVRSVTFGICKGQRCTWATARKLKPDMSAPFSANWRAPKRGTYTIVARAVDDNGNVKVSKPKRVTVRAPKGASQNRRR